jgi:amino acid transporter
MVSLFSLAALLLVPVSLYVLFKRRHPSQSPFRNWLFYLALLGVLVLFALLAVF